MMVRQVLLAAFLGIVTSCVPAVRPARMVVAQDLPRMTDSRTLLSALALQVPQGPLPAPAATDDAPFARPVAAAPPFLAAMASSDDADRAADCLTEAVYYEARSEPVDGQRAVAQVVLNRVRDRAFPHSVCGVVYQHGTRSSGCQFSFTCDGSMNGRREPHAWDRARAVAQAALAGDVYAPVGAAVFYHTQAVSPWWAPSLSRIGSIGAHIFYRWHDALARSLSFHERYAGLEPVAAARFVPAVAIATASAGPTQQGGVTIHRYGPVATQVVQTVGVRVHRGITPLPGIDAAPSEDAVNDRI